jgi:hypothetical protein
MSCPAASDTSPHCGTWDTGPLLAEISAGMQECAPQSLTDWHPSVRTRPFRMHHMDRRAFRAFVTASAATPPPPPCAARRLCLGASRRGQRGSGLTRWRHPEKAKSRTLRQGGHAKHRNNSDVPHHPLDVDAGHWKHRGGLSQVNDLHGMNLSGQLRTTSRRLSRRRLALGLHRCAPPIRPGASDSWPEHQAPPGAAAGALRNRRVHAHALRLVRDSGQTSSTTRGSAAAGARRLALAHALQEVGARWQ